MIKTFTRLFFVLVFLMSCSVSILKAQTPIWSDEFNGPTIDAATWTYDVRGDGMGNGELEYNTDRPANSFISGGNLVIQAQKEEFGGNHYTSARLKTLGRFSYKYGTLEARMKLPNLKNGLWPAFWTMGTNIGQVGWPKCGEFDILEAGSESARLKDSINQIMTGAVHWWQDNGTWSTWLQADASAPTSLSSGNFYDNYHTYKMVWDSTHVEFWLDSKMFFNMNTSDPNMSEFRKPQFIILNLAVGGKNYVNLTDPALITAALPAQMLVDYIRLYPIAGQTQIYYAKDSEKTGNFGVFSDRATMKDSLSFAKDGHLFFWNNVTTTTGAAYEGKNVLNCSMAAGAWWGLGYFNDTNLNMNRYSDGYLHLAIKTSSKEKIGVGVSSANGESYVDLIDGGQQYGLVRDGAWHEVNIPLNLFAVDFTTIVQPLILKGDAPAAAMQVSVDDAYWIEGGARPTPSNGNFGVYTETTTCSSKFTNGTDGNFYVWSNTLTPITSTASEGSSVLAFTSAAGLSWFGAAFTPNVKYNLTAFRYATSKLHFDLKTSSTASFQIGMKSGNTSNLNQTWINFVNGADPYGFVRDGKWHAIDIPMSDFANVDLSQVSQLFELLGTTGAISDIAIDNIYFSGGGAPIGTTVSVTGVSLAPTTVSISVGATSQLTATIAPSNATNTAVTYASSNTAIATVSASGLVTAVAPGTATITVTTADGAKTATCAVTVTSIAVTGVSLSPTTLSIAIGATSQLTATVAPSNATNKTVTYTSSNTAIATVSASGLVTAIATGTATITVKTTDGAKTATCAVTVTPIAVTGVSLSPTTVSIAIGATSQLAATVAPSNATNKAVSYASSNTAVATVSASGLVTGVTAGTATITVTTTDGAKTATCAVTVTSSASPIPGKIEAENYSSMLGVQTEATTDTGAGLNVGWIDATDYMNYNVNVATAGTYKVDFRIASTVATGVIQLKSGSTVLGSVTLPNTGGWQIWQTVSMNVPLSAGVQTLQIYVPAGGYNLNWINFTAVTSSCTVLASTGDFSTTISTDASNPTLTFVPAKTGMGATTCILYYNTTGTGTFPGYSVTANTPFRITAAAGQTVYFYYTYSLPTGGENNTAASKNSFTVGNCSTLKSASAGELGLNLQKEFVVYPNPNQGESVNLGLNGFEEGIANLEILNAAGIVVKEQAISISSTSSTESINISQLSNGVYIVKLKIGTDIQQRKLLINK